MPKNVPPEFVGRFSIKPKRLPKRGTSSSAIPTEKSNVLPEQSSHRRKLSEQSEAVTSPQSESSNSPSIFTERRFSSNTIPSGTTSEREKSILSPDIESFTRQASAEDDLAESYNQLARFTAQVPSPRIQSPYGASSTSHEPHPYEREIYHIFASSWSQRIESRRPYIMTAAKALAYGVEKATEPGPEVYILCIIQALKHYVSDQPHALDFLLLAFDQAAKLFPDTIVNEYGRGPSAGIQRMHSWLVDESKGFQGIRSPDNLGSLSITDSANLCFHLTDVTANLDKVLDQIQDWKRQRTSCIITAAMYTRSFALGLMRVEDGRQIESLINAGLVRTQSRWSVAGLISACLLLRGCAKALLEGDTVEIAREKLTTLRRALEEFIVGDGEFGVKAHATVSLPRWV